MQVLAVSADPPAQTSLARAALLEQAALVPTDLPAQTSPAQADPPVLEAPVPTAPPVQAALVPTALPAQTSPLLAAVLEQQTVRLV